LLIAPDGRKYARVDLKGPDDEEAKKQAQRLVPGYPVELWDGDRMIAKFGPGGKLPAGSPPIRAGEKG
jgi:hypothetical protein